jgi:predicted component of type VI protein secretion system
MKIGDVLEIGSNEFKVTNYQQGKICELTVIMGMRNYLQRNIEIKRQQVIFGRSQQHSMIYFDLDKTLSKRHGKFQMGKDGHFYYKDMGSLNGSWIKLKVNEPFRLEDGHILKMGEAL